MHKIGTDPFCWCYIKLYIYQIHNTLDSIPGLPSSHLLYHHPITKVEIMGLVIGIERRASHIDYLIDDGTAIIKVRYIISMFVLIKIQS